MVGRRLAALLRRNGLARCQGDFERADDAAHIFGRQVGRCLRVDLRQARMQRCCSCGACVLFQVGTQVGLRGNARNLPALKQCCQVLPRTAHQQRQPPTRRNSRQRSLCLRW